MAGIFLGGGIGFGKTKFCEVMSATYDIPLCTDVLTNIMNRNPFISRYTFEQKQFIYTLEYMKVHHIENPPRFLADRSILHTLAWSGYPADIVAYMGLHNRPPDLIIIIPTPSFDWYKYASQFILGDSVRTLAYRERLRSTKTQFDEITLLQLIYEQDREMHDIMIEMADILNWRVFEPEISSDTPVEDFRMQWQHQSHQAVVNVWGTLADAKDVSKQPTMVEAAQRELGMIGAETIEDGGDLSDE